MRNKLMSTRLSLTDDLPLTCSRAGTCCFGKTVWINPWELACLAQAKNSMAHEFRDQYCEFGGIRVRFDGASDRAGNAACSMYDSGKGCMVHRGRPLVCRLYPLGREKRGVEQNYLHRGEQFPCLEGCPEVAALPYLTVQEYLAGQEVSEGERVQDEYLGIVGALADGAFALLLDSGLAATGDRETLRLWRRLGTLQPDALVHHIGEEWRDRLMLPEISAGTDDPDEYVKQHHDFLQDFAQEEFGSLPDADAVCGASGHMMGCALYLARSLGADPAELAEVWIGTAKENGAHE